MVYISGGTVLPSYMVFYVIFILSSFLFLSVLLKYAYLFFFIYFSCFVLLTYFHVYNIFVQLPMRVCTCVCIYVCMWMCVYVWMYLCVYVHMCEHAYLYAFLCVYVCACSSLQYLSPMKKEVFVLLLHLMDLLKVTSKGMSFVWVCVCERERERVCV